MGDIDLKQRQFPIAFAKAYCKRIYGEPAKDTWRNWRQWAGVGKGAMLVNFDQLCCLAAIATIRVQQPRQELKRKDVKALAESLEIQEPIAAVIEHMDKTEIIAGCNALDALQCRGIQTNLRALYRKVPKFSQNRTYTARYLKLMVG